MSAEADLVTYLDSQLSETGGTNLFEGPAPETPDDLIAVSHYASEPSDAYVMSASLTAPGYDVERVQVMARSTVKATAHTRALAAHAVLDNLHGVTMSGRVYFGIESDGPPFNIGTDQNMRWRYVANYTVKKARG